jgi:pyruvate-formate lyase-activating enzyme
MSVAATPYTITETYPAFAPARGASVMNRDGCAHVIGLPQQWARAAKFDLLASGIRVGAVVITVTLTNQRGTFSIGVLSRDKKRYLIESCVPSGDGEVTLELQLSEIDRARWLVVRTSGECEATPEATIRRVTVLGGPDPPQAFQAPPSDDTGVFDPVVEALWPAPADNYTLGALSQLSRAQLDSIKIGDPIDDNLLLNKWEFATGADVLESYPWRLSVPFVLCNARCDFCSAWRVQGEPLPLEVVAALKPVLRHSRQVDLVGWGEPLIHPQFGEILDIIRRETNSRANVALTTNGVRLGDWLDRLIVTNVTEYSISIHAATAETHHDVMGLDVKHFPRIVEAVRTLCERKATNRGIYVAMVFIVMQQNIAEIPAFIELCDRLNVDKIFFRTLMPMDHLPEGLDYHRLPPYLHPDFERLREAAVAAIARAKAIVIASPETWSTPVFSPKLEAKLPTIPLTRREDRSKLSKRSAMSLQDVRPLGERIEADDPTRFPPLDNVYGRTAPLPCPSPYTAFYVNGFDGQVRPCCYMSTMPGYKSVYLQDRATFDQVWNAPSIVALRRSLRDGPLAGPCLKCPFYW